MNDTYVSSGLNYFSYVSKSIVDETVNFLTVRGFELSVRWVSLLLFFISLLLIWVALKIGKPIIKWVLIAIACILILGLIMPSW